MEARFPAQMVPGANCTAACWQLQSAVGCSNLHVGLADYRARPILPVKTKNYQYSIYFGFVSAEP